MGTNNVPTRTKLVSVGFTRTPHTRTLYSRRGYRKGGEGAVLHCGDPNNLQPRHAGLSALLAPSAQGSPGLSFGIFKRSPRLSLALHQMRY